MNANIFFNVVLFFILIFCIIGIACFFIKSPVLTSSFFAGYIVFIVWNIKSKKNY